MRLANSTRTLKQLAKVRMGDMTPEEKRLVTNDAVAKIQKELTEKAPQIEAILSEFKDG